MKLDVVAALPASMPPVATADVRRAVRLSYVQAMLGSIYGASTGGMFLIGYAFALGADYVGIGLLSTFPMLCVFAQLLSAMLVESGRSRRTLTFVAALLNVLGWGLIILIPYATADLPAEARIGSLIAIVTLVSFFGQIAGNARGSWVGDLVPERFRGRFFGRMTMYGSIIGTVFGVIEGKFLDTVKAHGIGAFSLLFGFGILFGLANAWLFRPQKDIPIKPHHESVRFTHLVGATFRNVPLLCALGFHLVFALQSVAGPFYVAYMLDALHMTYLQMGLVNSVVPLTMLACAPLWGRWVGRFGCRPVLIFSSALLASLQLSWIWVDTATRAFCIIAPINILAGFAIGGISVGITTLLYKLTPVAGRSVQLAIYSIIISLLAAPMPYLGGHLPHWLASAGLPLPDLRWNFYLAGSLGLLAALIGRFIREDGATSVGTLARHFWRLGWPWLAAERGG